MAEVEASARTEFTGKSASFWIETTPQTRYPPLREAISVDVAVIGGGIVGITAAVLLTRAGLSVAVIEARRMAEDVTGKTTAKITSLHDLVYDQLIKQFGEASARLYGESNQAALERIAAFVAERGIDCDFDRKAAYTYTTSRDNLPRIEAEAAAAQRLGLPASLVREASLPFPIAGAVRFDNQAQFHPRKYLLGLLAELEGAGAGLYEQTRVIDVEEDRPCRITTERGELTARNVILATNLPVVDPGGFFSRAYPRAHTVLAARIDPADAPDGMFLSIDQPSRSVRTAPAPDGGTMLIALGESYKPGHVDTEAKYEELAEWTRRTFRVRSVDYRWTNEDYVPADNLYFIGRMTPLSRAVYVATGLKAWGMTGGTLAAMILSDAIQGVPNPWAELYDPNRLNLAQAVGTFTRENVHVAGKWVGDKLRGGVRRKTSDLQPGEAAVIHGPEGKVAVYRDPHGQFHCVSARCTHMGCDVGWNAVDQTWDCPCHGSRFTVDGAVIHGPAVERLEPQATD